MAFGYQSYFIHYAPGGKFDTSPEMYNMEMPSFRRQVDVRFFRGFLHGFGELGGFLYGQTRVAAIAVLGSSTR